ncbi:hypothetical protein BVC80_1183g19 [Macleaya cordata]|uniref:Uncharacterized protein n=1 Tax=Macleaya cordata TaxID=56857 RepID=A0A200PQ45_MACCD|nr:hypothetical protein BVC80_1183g19 [Macleaya cordata]
MAGFLVLIPSLLFIILSLSKITPVIPHLQDSQMICKDNTNPLICEIQEMKLKISRLESILEESMGSLNTKIHNLEEKEKLIEKMDDKIDFLQTELINLKKDSTYAVERVNALEEEVRLLWAASRKNNFDLHSLESKVQDTEINLEVVASEVEKIGSIVTEQWIQIRQLDQALQVTEMRILRVQSKTGSTRCTFLKFIKDFSVLHHPKLHRVLDLVFVGKKSFLGSYMSQALYQFKRIVSAAQRYHHEVYRRASGTAQNLERERAGRDWPRKGRRRKKKQRGSEFDAPPPKVSCATLFQTRALKLVTGSGSTMDLFVKPMMKNYL